VQSPLIVQDSRRSMLRPQESSPERKKKNRDEPMGVAHPGFSNQCKRA